MTMVNTSLKVSLSIVRDMQFPFVDVGIMRGSQQKRSLKARERVYAELKEKCNVFTRRYFYPLLTDFAPYADAKGSCPVAEDAARRVLTLPTYYGLSADDARAIAEDVLEVLSKCK